MDKNKDEAAVAAPTRLQPGDRTLLLPPLRVAHVLDVRVSAVTRRKGA